MDQKTRRKHILQQSFFPEFTSKREELKPVYDLIVVGDGVAARTILETALKKALIDPEGILQVSSPSVMPASECSFGLCVGPEDRGLTEGQIKNGLKRHSFDMRKSLFERHHKEGFSLFRKPPSTSYYIDQGAVQPLSDSPKPIQIYPSFPKLLARGFSALNGPQPKPTRFHGEIAHVRPQKPSSLDCGSVITREGFEIKGRKIALCTGAQTPELLESSPFALSPEVYRQQESAVADGYFFASPKALKAFFDPQRVSFVFSKDQAPVRIFQWDPIFDRDGGGNGSARSWLGYKVRLGPVDSLCKNEKVHEIIRKILENLLLCSNLPAAVLRVLNSFLDPELYKFEADVVASKRFLLRDRLPFIGPLDRNFFLATAFHKSGWLWAPQVAQMFNLWADNVLEGCFFQKAHPAFKPEELCLFDLGRLQVQK